MIDFRDEFNRMRFEAALKADSESFWAGMWVGTGITAMLFILLIMVVVIL